MKAICLIEGFAGGSLHTKNFRKALVKAGFKLTKNRHQTEAIIAHSAGIYAIPDTTQAKLLILIGPTYYPGQRLIKRVLRHLRLSKNYHVSKFGWRYYIWKKLLEVYYFFRRHKYMWLGIRHNNRLDHIHKLAAKEGRKIILIRNQDDPFNSAAVEESFQDASNVRFVSLPGVHDDYVTNPRPYIDLLLKELK